jgi:transposase-like protein
MDFFPINSSPDTFNSEEKCIQLLEKVRWNGIIISPFSETSKVYYCQNGNYKCRDTGKYFNVKTHTLFHNSRVSLQKWFSAIWILSVEKKEITSVDLAKTLGVTQKTAWYMLQQIREAFGLKKTKVTRKRKLPKPLESIEVSVDADKQQMIEWLKQLKK